MWTPHPKNRQQLRNPTQQQNPTIRPLIHHQNTRKTDTTTNKHPHMERRKRKQMDVRRHQQLPLQHPPNRQKPNKTHRIHRLNPTQPTTNNNPKTTQKPRLRVCGGSAKNVSTYWLN